MSVRPQRVPGTPGLVGGMTAEIASDSLRWEYLPGTYVPVPIIQVLIKPKYPGLQALLERARPLAFDRKLGGFVAEIALTSLETVANVRLLDEGKNFEDWQIVVDAGFQDTRVFVDQTCADHFTDLFEIDRSGPGFLVFVGCERPSGTEGIRVQIKWDSVQKVTYGFKEHAPAEGVFQVPTDQATLGTSEFVGETGEGRSVLSTTPSLLFPIELEAGLAVYSAQFSQTNFPSVFSQVATAAFVRVWWRRPGQRFTALARGFLSAVALSEKLDPERAQPESMKTNYVSVEARYQLWERHGFSIAPVLGGWFYFTTVSSGNFGLQRIVDPIVGIGIEKSFPDRSRLNLSYRVAPLQAESGIGTVTGDKAFIELELAYSRPVWRNGRIGAHLIHAAIDYEPPAPAATTQGKYWMLGVSYSFQ